MAKVAFFHFLKATEFKDISVKSGRVFSKLKIQTKKTKFPIFSVQNTAQKEKIVVKNGKILKSGGNCHFGKGYNKATY